MLGACQSSFAATRSERSSVDRIEELMLRDDFSGARYACEKFIKDYPRSRYRSRVLYLKDISDKKLFAPKEPVVKKTMKQEQGTSATGTFAAVQIGPFTSFSAAKSTAVSLRDKKFEAIVKRAYSGSNKVYYVRLGKFRNHSNAEKLVKKLKSVGYIANISYEE